MENKRRKIEKGKVENWKWKEGNLKKKKKNEDRTFFFTFKTTEICFGSTKMGIFYLEKAFHAEKKKQKQKQKQKQK